jgi:hypothetical protein
MRHYWLKIVVGMLGVFAVGMVIVTAVRHGSHRVRSVFDTAEPISIPLAFVPFKLNGTKVGSIDHLTVLRSSPKKVRGADLTVTLADSVPASRLTGCVLVAERIDKLDEHSTFTCAQPADTADRDLVPAGSVRVSGGPTLPFFADRSELADFTDNAHERADSVAQAQSELADSLADVLGNRIDSLKEVRDSLMRDRSAVVVNVRGVNVDSIRTVTRHLVDSALHQAMQARDSLRHHPIMPTPPPAPHVPRSR